MKKIIAFIIAAAVLIGVLPAKAQTAYELSIEAPYAILMEKETGTVLYEKSPHERVAPASVTKIMTMLLVVEAIEAGTLSLDDMVTAGVEATKKGGSQIYLKEGEKMSVEDLLKSVAVSSANDAATALAEHIAGTEGAFVAKMNERAKELGMENTVFSNCTGLPTEGEHLTTAYDIALMARELISHDMIKEFTTIWIDSVRNGEFGLSNTNKLIRFYEGATGLKTGYTEEAMYCLAATAERDGTEYIAVVMKAPSSDARFESAKTLLNYAFATYTLIDIAPAEVLPPIPVSLGEVQYVQPVLSEGGKLLVEKTEASSVVRKTELEESLTAPVEAGQVIGRLTIETAGGELLHEENIVAGDNVDRLGWFEIFTDYLSLIFTGHL